MIQMFNSPDSASAAPAMQAMFKMKKLDIAALRAAYEGN
jgi:predicted 3-demethylubiquinone-9 3-methyltransferase (glyoxalase superfamily)